MQGSILDLAFSPRTSDVSHTDILIPLGTSDHANLSIHFRDSTAALVGAWRGPNVWRIHFKETLAGAADTLWVTDCDNVGRTWDVFKKKVTGLVNSSAPIHIMHSQVYGFQWFYKGLRRQFHSRNRARRHHP